MGTLRFILALAVLWFHFIAVQNNFSLNGLIAVDAFFIISGFYIALILDSKYIHSSYWIYISNRFLRIYPLYWIVYIATFVFIFYSHYSSQINISNLIHYFIVQYPEPTLLLKELTLIIPRGYLTVYSMHQPIVAPAWSLVVEVMFYITAPLFIRRKTFVILSILIASFIIRYILLIQQNNTHAGYLLGFFPANMGFFCMGILAYRLFNKKIFIKSKKLFSFLIIFLLSQIVFWGFMPNIFFLSIPLREVIFFLTIFTVIPTLFNITQRFSFDRLLGDLSYPMYITHLLILELFEYMKLNNYNYPLFIIISIFSILTTSYVLYKFIDRPLNTFRQKRIDYST